MYDVIIVGGGPAGLTAALYTLRAGKTALVIEKAAFGGQITWSPKVENFPTVESVSGSELADRLMQQVEKQGGETEFAEVVSVEKQGEVFRITTDYDDVFESRAVIAAVGAKPRALGISGEEELVGSGVCYCAVCDGAFYKGKAVAVNGGGNSALQDAMLLSEGCSRVYLIHRRDSFRGEAKLAEALKKKENVEFVLNSSVTALIGDTELTAITVTDREGVSRNIEAEGLFVAIGHSPDNRVFEELMELDEAGYVLAGEDCRTRTPGLFTAGDCRRKTVRQLTTAMADGSAAALAACSYIDSRIPPELRS